MPPAFLQEPVERDDQLYPLTRFRLALLIRGALARQPQGGVPTDAVYAEVWERRTELIGQLPQAREDFEASVRRDQDVEYLAFGADAVAAALGFASFWLFGNALWNTTQRLTGHPRTSVFTAITQVRVAWLAVAAAGAMWLGARWWARRRWALTYHIAGLGMSHAGRVKSDLEDAVAAMVDQICHRGEELTRGVLLSAMRAPSLVEFDRASVVPLQSFGDVLTLINAHVTSAVGIAGTRGAGKSTLLRMLCNSDEDGRGARARIGVYLAAPASSAEGEFVKVIYGTTVRRVLGTQDVSLDTRSRWRRPRIRPGEDVVLARRALEQITGTASRSRQRGLQLAGSGLSASIGGQKTWTERDLSHADWVAEFRDYLASHRLRGGDPILIAIDELDKMADPAQVISVINGLKDLFHIPGAHFVVSVSDDAMRSFATRGIPVRDAFDSAFDTVIEIPHLTAQESRLLLQARVRLFPDAIALFCHAWSGGVPRDLIRVARSCIAIPHKLGRSVAVPDLAQRIIRHDVREFVSALINGTGEQRGHIGPLLELGHLLADDSKPLHQQLSDPGHLDDAVQGQAWEDLPQGDAQLALASLQQFLCVASVVNEYFSTPRSAQEWVNGIDSALTYRDADLLAQAKAALAIHPREAAWRLGKATAILGMSAPASDRLAAS